MRRDRVTRHRVAALLAAAIALTGCAETADPSAEAGRSGPGRTAGGTADGTASAPVSPGVATARPGRPIPSAEPTGGTLDLSRIQSSALDYDPVPSPEALAAMKPIVAVGEVDGWQRGPTLGVLPGDPPVSYVLMRVRVTYPLKGVRTTPSLRGGVMFIEFERAYKESVADFEEAIPTGTRVLVFPRERPPYNMGIRSQGDPLPDGAKIMAVHPQGLVIEDPGLVCQGAERTLVGGYEPLTGGSRAAWLEPRTMDEMIDRLRRYGFSEEPPPRPKANMIACRFSATSAASAAPRVR
ncbi:hypothetical protein [Microtetraspora glauca]|uniref:Lipoprotein n=1 Tax=Microtetraspora glauca TaxID=1996 RepID=A0ABV3G8U7_MICGL